MNKVLKSGIFSFVLCASPQLTNAASPGAYFGGGAGLAQLESLSGFNQADDNVFGARAFFGYNFNRHFGIEANYYSINKASYMNNDYRHFGVDASLNALSLVGKAYLPLSDESPVNLYVLLGIAQLNEKLDFTYQELSWATASDNGVVPTLGLGVTYELNQHLTTGIELSAFSGKKPKDSAGIPSSALASLSLAYKF